MPINLKEKISRLMDRVQKSLFSHLNECLHTLLPEQKQLLITIQKDTGLGTNPALYLF